MHQIDFFFFTQLNPTPALFGNGKPADLIMWGNLIPSVLTQSSHVET